MQLRRFSIRQALWLALTVSTGSLAFTCLSTTIDFHKGCQATGQAEDLSLDATLR
jgi:hypothetical protein